MNVVFLEARAIAAANLGMLDQALTDFRGECATIRMIGPSWKREPSIQQVTLRVLHTMAKIKHRDNAARPHYTLGEREDWEKELGIGDYSLDRFFCANCGATRSNTIKLKVCTMCKCKWFCSKACIAEAWKHKGHKQECKELQKEKDGQSHAVSSEEMQGIRDEIEREGCMTMPGSKVIMFDAEKEVFFDSLSDSVMEFAVQEDQD